MTKTPIPAGRLGAARRATSLLLFALCALASSWAVAQELEFRPPKAIGDPATPAIMRDLALRMLPVYQESDPGRYLTNLSALQMAALNYTAAYATRQSLRDRRRSMDSGRPVDRTVIYDIYAHARAIEAETRMPFAQAFTNSYRDVVSHFDDADAYAVTRWFATPLPMFQEALRQSFDQQRSKDSISLPAAFDLIWTYIAFEAYRSFGPLVDVLDAEDDARRYTTDGDILIKTPDGAHISAIVIRPKSPSKPLPTLFEFTIYDSENYAKECASHGYVGVVAFARGKHASTDRIVPYQHDGDDARAAINWIAQQSWSDGRVGMYGDRYSGFTPWAAAKRLPPALRAIATSASSAPGIDVPMGGNIFQNSAYRWSLYVTNTKAADAQDFYDDARWRALDEKWYISGKRYRDFGSLYGKSNPIFIRWLNHPSYDRFWQTMIPFRKQFAHINIPVLATSGYYAGSQPGTLYYFDQHYRFNANADQTLVIGPYDDSVMQRGPLTTLQGYEIDPAADVDLHDLRYRWFDYVLKGGAKPALLQDRINYEVMGSNEWRHAPSLDAMATGSIRFYLDGSASNGNRRLIQHKNSKVTFFRQTVKLTDRSDAAWRPPTDLISRSLAIHDNVIFASEPLAKPAEFNGLFSGRFDLTVNKMDIDLNITLYELLASGDYVRLFKPAFEFRASYVRDRVHRHLLKAGEREHLTFRSERMTSRQMQAGSRLVMVLGVSKRPDREINYGTGDDVSEESIADGRTPIKIRWYSDSFIDIPVRR